jgi:hypothetical protein
VFLTFSSTAEIVIWLAVCVSKPILAPWTNLRVFASDPSNSVIWVSILFTDVLTVNLLLTLPAVIEEALTQTGASAPLDCSI